MSTGIEWTEETWNPVVGCSIISPGCKNCYAMRQAHRLAKNPRTPHYHGTTEIVNGRIVWTGEIGIAPDRTLFAPCRRKRPTMYFVNSMSDLFHQDVPDASIDRVFGVMALCPQHTFQVLTKRAERMSSYLAARGTALRIHAEMMALARNNHPDPDSLNVMPIAWPLANVWLGISIERQFEAEMRIPYLLKTPARIHFLSVEPMLGPVDLAKVQRTHAAHQGWLDWVICGGESGPGARQFEIEWARSLRAQCGNAGVPLFMKQLGATVTLHGFTGMPLKDRKGGDMTEWPPDLQVREMPAIG